MRLAEHLSWAMLPVRSSQNELAAIASIGAVQVSAMPLLVANTEGAHEVACQSPAGCMKRAWESSISLMMALACSLSLNIVLLLHKVCRCRKRRAQVQHRDLKLKLLTLQLESLIVQELRDKAERMGYVMDSSRLTKQLLVAMIMAKGEDELTQNEQSCL